MATLGKLYNLLTWLKESPGLLRRFLEALANLLDLFRVIPRLLMTLYCWILYDITIWFKALPDPLASQSAFIAVVYGAGTGLFGLYLGSKRDTKKIVEEAPPPLTDQPPAEVAR